MEHKLTQKWKDVIETIGEYMRASGLDVDNEPLYSRLYEFIGDEIMDKVKRSWRAEELQKRISKRVKTGHR